MATPGIALVTSSKHLSHAQLAPWIGALKYQHALVCRDWRRVPVGVYLYNKVSDIPADQIAVVFGDTLDDPDALAYHTEERDQRFTCLVDVAKILSLGGTLASGSLSVTAAAGHEIAEVTIDPFCNAYCESAAGELWALEVSDPVQGWSFEHNGVTLSDYVPPSFFDPEQLATIKTMGGETSPFNVADGGYAIVMKGGKMQQLGGDTPAFKAHLPWSRRSTRLGQRPGHAKYFGETVTLV